MKLPVHCALRALPFLLPVFLLAGCFLAPTLDSLSKTGLTPRDRRALLPERIKLFQDSLYWGSADDALAVVLPESREALRSELRGLQKKERLVDSKVDGIDFSDQAFEATVEITMRSYRIPVYVVESRTERQSWTFSIASGWMLKSREVVATGEP